MVPSVGLQTMGAGLQASGPAAWAGLLERRGREPTAAAVQFCAMAGNHREVLQMARTKDLRRWLLEAWEYAQMTPEERREREIQREEAKRQREEAKRRRALAKIGLTPEEFDEGVREFGRKFFPEQE